ncbi:MAG: right-handed parallel beta-helix repeat-containing protein [Candidatus Lokiarchaeota archaeon]|nr:right-handed parallel beta-helix repeat-containing protein [Candidatus Lokiarchaeota archaeon]
MKSKLLFRKRRNHWKVIRNKKGLLLASGFFMLLIAQIFIGGIRGTPKQLNSSLSLKDTRTSDYWVLTSPIYINDTGAFNWSWARTQDWCRTGNGSRDNPYVIENITINGKDASPCIEICDSNAYFIVRNCTLFNSSLGGSASDAGLLLVNVSNGFIVDNNCSFNQGNGIYLYNSCYNNTISNNIVNYNGAMGVRLYRSDNNTISNNHITKNTGTGIYFIVSNNNTISNNVANHQTGGGIYVLNYSNNNTVVQNIASNNSAHGMRVEYYSDYNQIINNNASNNRQNGINLYSECRNNTISNNIFNDNRYGINVEDNCDNNTIMGNEAQNLATFNQLCGICSKSSSYNRFLENRIVGVNWSGIAFINDNTNNLVYKNVVKDCTLNGIQFLFGDNNNTIYRNFFVENGANGTTNARDSGAYNRWNNGSLGNLYGNYAGNDTVAPFGIGDTPYNLSGSSGSQDDFPIMDLLPSIVDLEFNISLLIEGHSIQFACNGTGGNEEITYYWDFGDGHSSTEQNPVHRYEAPGIYTVNVSVSDIDGDINSTALLNFIEVLEDLIPIALFETNQTDIFEGRPIRFLFLGSEGNPNATFHWDFGDGTTSTERNPVHVYSSQGIYNITFMVTDWNGQSATQIKEITVNVQPVNPQEEEKEEEEKGEDPLGVLTIIAISAGITGTMAVPTSYLVYRSKKGAKIIKKASQKASQKIKKKKGENLKGKKVEELSLPSKPASEIMQDLSNKDELLKLFKADISPDVIANASEKPLTIVSEKFLKSIDNLGFSGELKKDFVRDLLSFSPSERAQVTQELVSGSEVVPVPVERKRAEEADVLVHEGLALDMIREYIEKHRTFDPVNIVPYLNSRFAKASINVNADGVRKIMRSLVEKNIVVEGSILTRENVLENENRKVVFELIKTNPGVHFNKLVKKSRLPRTVVRWHLKMLERFEFVRVEKMGNQHAYFDVLKSYDNAEIIHFLSQKKTRAILEYMLSCSEGCHFTEMRQELGMHYNTIKKYLKKLESFDIVSKGNKVYYHINKKKLKELDEMI